MFVVIGFSVAGGVGCLLLFDLSFVCFCGFSVALVFVKLVVILLFAATLVIIVVIHTTNNNHDQCLVNKEPTKPTNEKLS